MMARLSKILLLIPDGLEEKSSGGVVRTHLFEIALSFILLEQMFNIANDVKKNLDHTKIMDMFEQI